MNTSTPRLRMIAGPNGSGKSRIREILQESIVGIFVNADEIQLALESDTGLDFSRYKLDVESESLNVFISQHPLFVRIGLKSTEPAFEVTANVLNPENTGATGYLYTLLADFIRKRLIENRTSFTFETVMSSFDKIETLRLAKSCGFRTYLYYVATDDSTINVERVGFRVKMGGHSVPENKIRDRYSKSLRLLLEAIKCTNRAYVWDNSGSEPIFIAEITEGSTLEFKSDAIPNWFQSAVVNRLKSNEQ